MSNQSVNLSLDYDPNASIKMANTNADSPMSSVPMLMSGLLPDNLLNESELYRDAAVGLMVALIPEMDYTVLGNFTNWLRAVPGNDPSNVRAAEYLALLSFSWGDKELAKRAMLRIDPKTASTMLKTVYVAMQERQMQPADFKRMLVDVKDRALEQWRASTNSI